MGLCEEMGHQVDVLVHYTAAKCIPALMSTGTDFIFISEKPVFSVEASKKAWMLVVVLAVGKTLNSEKPFSMRTKYFSETCSMAKETTYVTIPASLAKSLQRKVYSGEMSLDVEGHCLGPKTSRSAPKRVSSRLLEGMG